MFAPGLVLDFWSRSSDPGKMSKTNAIENVNVIGNVANVTQNRTPTQRANVSSLPSVSISCITCQSCLPCPGPPLPLWPLPLRLTVCLALLSDKFPVTEFCLSNLNRCFLLSLSLSFSLSISSTLAVPVRQVCQQHRYCRKSAVWPVDGGLSTQLTDNTWFRGVSRGFRVFAVLLLI